MKKKKACFLVCKGRSNDDVGVATGIVFSGKTARELVFKTGGDFVKEKLGGGYRGTTPA